MHCRDCRLFSVQFLLRYVLTLTYKQAYEVIQLTSEERHEARYQRRKQQRELKKQKRTGYAETFEDVFSYQNLYKAYRHCRRNVAWKNSVQNYIFNAPLQLAMAHEKLMNGTYKSPGFYEFDLYERGKKRHIRSTNIAERVVQNCLCENVLIPALSPTLIYDNGAAMAGKGYKFAVDRLEKHLRQHIRQYGNEGYILLFDFSKFFDNVSHEVIKKLIKKEITDEKVISITSHFIDMFGEKGLGLGSQISQILALVSATKLDHYIKENLRIKANARYNDDGYLIHPSKEYLQECLTQIKAICDELGITLNTKKTQIFKISRGFTFIQVRFYVTSTGKIIKKLSRSNITRRRRTLKKYKKKVAKGEMTLKSVAQSWQSWKAYASNFNSYYTVQNMTLLFNDLFKEYNLNDKVYKAFLTG